MLTNIKGLENKIQEIKCNKQIKAKFLELENNYIFRGPTASEFSQDAQNRCKNKVTIRRNESWGQSDSIDLGSWHMANPGQIWVRSLTSKMVP